MEEDVAKSREAGFDEHITKPVNFDSLQAAIKRVTAATEAEAEAGAEARAGGSSA
jgi:DNA-binding response OmpR family regulator